MYASLLVAQERDVRQLLRPTPRGQIGVSFDTSSGTLSGIQNMLDRGGLEGDGETQKLEHTSSTRAFPIFPFHASFYYYEFNEEFIQISKENDFGVDHL